MDSTTTVFTKKTLVFDSNTMNVEQVPLPIPRAQFGILNLNAISAPSSGTTLDLLFSVDQSGSMSDTCSDGRTKMQHITHTLKNMILYFRDNPHIKVYITIDSFDESIYSIVERTAITPENLSELLAKVDLLTPRGSTDIEAALIHAEKRVGQMKTDFPSHTICHVFMTDGVANTGEQRPNELARLINRDITNAFIGFGIEHDGALLSSIGSGKNATYYFIDKIENSGLVYGEILHGIVYKFITNARITVDNGYIYDFKNNTWVQQLDIEDIVSEADKSYHIASHHTTECAVSFTGSRIGDSYKIHYTIMHDDDQFEDLSKFLYRQRTLQYLFAVNNYLKELHAEEPVVHDLFAFVTPRRNNPGKSDAYVSLRNNLREFIAEMKQFMTDQLLMDDNFMKNLCDDIYICYRTFGTKYGTMYANSRQASQGNQRCYAVTHTPDDVNPPPPILRRNGAGIKPFDVSIHIRVDDSDESDNDLIEHHVSGCNNTPYRTPGSARVMRALSSNVTPPPEDDLDGSQLP